MNFVQFFLGRGLLITGLFLTITVATTFKQVQAFELTFEAHSAQSFAQPHDITLSPDQRYLYVADNNNDRIAVLDSQSLDLVGSFGKGEVSEPHDVVFSGRWKVTGRGYRQ